MRQYPEERKDRTDNRFLGCLRSAKVEHYSDMEDDHVNWGRTSGTYSPFNVIFFWRLICGRGN